MRLPLTDAELAMLHALAAPIDGARRPEFLTAVTKSSRLQVPPRSGQAFCIGLRAQSCGFLGSAAGSSSGRVRTSRRRFACRMNGTTRTTSTRTRLADLALLQT